jgi:hypothetical protein
MHAPGLRFPMQGRRKTQPGNRELTNHLWHRADESERRRPLSRGEIVLIWNQRRAKPMQRKPAHVQTSAGPGLEGPRPCVNKVKGNPRYRPGGPSVLPRVVTKPSTANAIAGVTREDYRYFILSSCILRPLFATLEGFRSTCIGFFFFGHFFVWENE